MFKFLFVMFFMFLVLVFLMGFSFVRTLKEILFGRGKKTTRKEQRRQTKRTSTTQQRQSPHSSANVRAEAIRSRKKLFTPDDGEYVDYEEIK